MDTPIYRDFVQQMQAKYGKYKIADLTIYYKTAENPKPIHLTGEELIPDVLELYFGYEGPKYIVVEDKGSKPLRYTDRYFSRLVYPVRVPGRSFLFVLSSEQREAYETIAADIVNDINQFKQRV